ncbi:hypothetical protein PB01_09010 [Psychrobacillus glaciei]|uniref:Uncharacterized protein n=1 Tax=Psychrobacillus glaciei TaxID=2283160 RepID=A0A5J6SLT2_9BACI|nr:hypothetical protein [Psychrobacillus glaciei]QFF98960.1 hypothetical protein PB01_09010 [Psychrobacillus glaciei]
MDENDILSIIKQLEPKLQSVLFQTRNDYREDLEQDLKERIINIIKNNINLEVPSFFDLIGEELMLDYSEGLTRC